MAEYLKTGPARSMLRLVLVLAALAVTATANAQTLPDPTRPPASLTTSQEQGAATVSSAPVLQSVLISPVRTVAIISGKSVKVGDKLGDARVVKITESEVTLQQGRDVQRLQLFPGIEKKQLHSSSAGAKTKSDRRAQ